MNLEAIRDYWDNRASGDSSAQSTTQDVYLREIEFAALSERIARSTPRLVADVGCGDGRTTGRLAATHQTSSFYGIDYSNAMIDNARRVNNASAANNLTFQLGDVSTQLTGTFDLIYTTRCLINLPGWDSQQDAIVNIRDALVPGGVYLMVENFLEGQANFNEIRAHFGLPAIPVREHNCFFQRQRLLDFISRLFSVEEEINISSTYYLVSRIVYAKICAQSGVAPDYYDDHHRLAAMLPFSGEYGPVRLLSLKKK